jgi:VIT1/CCC1 family predicted Fe2+/Mn2+ transporter
VNLSDSELKDKLKEELDIFIKKEYIAFLVYSELSKRIKGKNKEIIKKIADSELKHYKTLKEIYNNLFGNYDLKLNFKEKIELLTFKFVFLLGPLFTLKFFERNEKKIINDYEKLIEEINKLNKNSNLVSNLKELIKEEKEHEKILIDLVKDKKSEHLSSIVLGINDALVELTGALTGLVGLFNDNLKIGLSGLITGIAASLSMAASSYLSKKAETNNNKEALIAALYTGLAYIITVLILVFPYFLINNKYFAMILMIINVLLVILFYTFYYSIVKEANFKKEFITMTLMSFSVSLLTFILGKLSDYLFFN